MCLLNYECVCVYVCVYFPCFRFCLSSCLLSMMLIQVKPMLLDILADWMTDWQSSAKATMYWSNHLKMGFCLLFLYHEYNFITFFLVVYFLFIYLLLVLLKVIKFECVSIAFVVFITSVSTLDFSSARDYRPSVAIELYGVVK